MRYQHTPEIHERIEVVLRLIETGQYSTPALVKEVGVSIPTISRIVAALRQRGHEIRSERHDGGWRYILRDAKKARKQKHGYTHGLALDIQRQFQPRFADHDEATDDPPSGTPAVPHKTASARNLVHEACKPQKQVSLR